MSPIVAFLFSNSALIVFLALHPVSCLNHHLYHRLNDYFKHFHFNSPLIIAIILRSPILHAIFIFKQLFTLSEFATLHIACEPTLF